MRNIKLKLMDADSNVMVTRGKGVGGDGSGGLINGDGRRFDSGSGQTLGNTDLVSQKCILDTHMILLINVTPII